MVNQRKPIPTRKVSADPPFPRRQRLALTHIQCFLREIRSRHYSTSHNAPRFAFTPTHVERSDPDVSRYPFVESNFSDAARQPWIHDFNIKLQHGNKESRFRLFMKRGKVLNPNACAGTIVGDVVLMRAAVRDSKSVVNMRSTDSRIADFVFHAYAQLFKYLLLVPDPEFVVRSSALQSFKAHSAPDHPKSSSSSERARFPGHPRRRDRTFFPVFVMSF
jgi:hypothetical protein